MSKSILKIALGQLNFLVGDVENNFSKVRAAVDVARNELNADIIVFSELAAIGYPSEDLLLRPKLISRTETTITQLLEYATDITIIVGAPWEEGGELYNSALVLQNKSIVAKYYKQTLPNYNVFDEKRYFSSGSNPCVFQIGEVSVGLTICEDLWRPEPSYLAKKNGAQCLININASPYHAGKQLERESEACKRINEVDIPIVYVNQVGGQDELVFDGCSFAMDREKKVAFRAPECKEGIFLVEYDKEKQDVRKQETIELGHDENQSIYNILTYGLQEYVGKNGFNGGIIGLSGGIDSALALSLAVDALGPERVHAVMMPFKYTSQMSIEDAQELADNLQVKYSVINIESIYDSFVESLAKQFQDHVQDSTEENIQARIRGVLLMALSNKFHYMVISTGNKSEMAVGYATLYGDMAGGFAPLKDVPKTKVYELANYRNKQSRVIPQRIIDRPPSAELAPDQVDQDSLPPYEILDQILELFVEQDLSREEIIARGFDKDTVAKVIAMVFRNEYKRRQAPPGVKITKRAFGKDRRYPITSGVLNYLGRD